MRRKFPKVVSCSSSNQLKFVLRKFCFMIDTVQPDSHNGNVSVAATTTNINSSANGGVPFISMDKYCFRNFVFDGNPYNDKAFIKYDKELFTNKVNQFYKEGIKLCNGYAPFCKHLFIPNFIEKETNEQIENSILEINDLNIKYLKSDYIARRKEELAVLTRWFDKSKIPKNMIKNARYFDIILYHKTQCNKENKAMSLANPDVKYIEQLSEYAIVSIKPQSVDFEIPMDPITMMRNALPLEQGGSGVALNKQEYDKSVAFWQKHAKLL